MINPTSQIGFNSSTAATYEAGRPEFPFEHVRTVLGRVCPTAKQRPGLDLYEIGAGSGKFTRPLHRALMHMPEHARPRLVAVEPSGMAEVLGRTHPSITIMRGTAEDLATLPEASGCAAICANSFHWFANAQSVSALRHALCPGGGLAVVFLGDWSADPWWQQQLAPIFAPLLDGSAPHLRPEVLCGSWLNTADTWQAPIRKSGAFSPLEYASWPMPDGGFHMSRPAFHSYVKSFSFVAKQTPAIQQEVVDKVDAVLERATAYRRDGSDGEASWVLPMVTHAFFAQRLS